MTAVWLPPWFDGFFLSMLATSVIVVSVNWDRYYLCTNPLHVWIVVDYATVFVFRVLMFVDNGLAAGMGPEANQVDREMRFKGRMVVLSCLALLLYPFLWAWTVVGSIWFSDTRSCLPEEGQKWGFLIWLVFSYSGLICIACISAGKWLLRRQAHLLLVSNRLAPVSEFQVLVEIIRVPGWTFQLGSSSQEAPTRPSQALTSYPTGLYVTPGQRERVERAIQQLPTFRLKVVSSENNGCPICLDEFEVGTEVRGLPCAHNFHVACIDEWLRLNTKCPHCRCPVFPDLHLTEGALPGQATSYGRNSDGTIIVTVPSTRFIRAQPGVGQSNLLQLQELLRSSQAEHLRPSQSLLSEGDELSRGCQAEEAERATGGLFGMNSRISEGFVSDEGVQVSACSRDGLASSDGADGNETQGVGSHGPSLGASLPDTTTVEIDKSPQGQS